MADKPKQVGTTLAFSGIMSAAFGFVVASLSTYWVYGIDMSVMGDFDIFAYWY